MTDLYRRKALYSIETVELPVDGERIQVVNVESGMPEGIITAEEFADQFELVAEDSGA